MVVKPNTTIVDVAFNLYGSLAGIPAVLKQLPVGERIGFDTLPELHRDVEDIGQTWTPDLVGVTLDITPIVYNPSAVAKAPFSTNTDILRRVYAAGENLVQLFYENGLIE